LLDLPLIQTRSLNEIEDDMARQGKVFSEDEVRKILTLLATTDMAIPDIALRMRCSRGAIASLNRKYKIREYRGLRSTWTQAEAVPAEVVSRTA
jgi:hypothetical protein